MEAPEVLSVMPTVCAEVNEPVAGVMAGVAAADELPVLYVQVTISCVAFEPPVPPVNPTYAELPPTVPGMLIGQDFVKVSAGIAVSVMVIASVVPS
jgi:hypothetical protein